MLTTVHMTDPPGTFHLHVPEGSDPQLTSYRQGRLPQGITPLLRALLATTRPGARVLDVGGYIGGFGLAAAALGYEAGIVEANPANAESIARSIAANSFAKPPQLVGVAIGATRGQVSFASNGPWGHVAVGGAAGETVLQITLPEVLQRVGWDAPAFIKMDVEGSEVNAMRGAAAWFAAGHRPVVLYEANGHTLSWFQSSPRALNQIFDDLGYVRYEVEDDGGFREPAGFEPRCLVDYVVSPAPLKAQPPRGAWKLLKRTARALRSPSADARRYTQRLLWSSLRGQ